MIDPVTKATISMLQSPMGDNGWTLTQPGGVGNDFVLEYFGTSTQYLPALTVRKPATAPSLSYFKVTSCTGFGIQMISTLWYLNFQSYTTSNPISGNQNLLPTTPLSIALMVGLPVIAVLVVGLTLGLQWKKLRAQYAALELKITKPK